MIVWISAVENFLLLGKSFKKLSKVGSTASLKSIFIFCLCHMEPISFLNTLVNLKLSTLNDRFALGILQKQMVLWKNFYYRTLDGPKGIGPTTPALTTFYRVKCGGSRSDWTNLGSKMTFSPL